MFVARNIQKKTIKEKEEKEKEEKDENMEKDMYYSSGEPYMECLYAANYENHPKSDSVRSTCQRLNEEESLK